MSTSETIYNYLVNTDAECVTPYTYYRAIFADGELEKAGCQERGKYNALIELTNGKFIFLHDDLQNIPDYEKIYGAKMNYIGYAGQTGEDSLARELHAFAIRIVLPDSMVWQDLFAMFHRHKKKNATRICPTFILDEGASQYFVYVLTSPLPMYKKFLKKISNMHNTLSREIHKGFEEACFSSCKKPRQRNIYARHGVVGTIVGGDLCSAYQIGDVFSLDDINALLPKTDRLIYHKSTVSLDDAQVLWPEWYHYRVEQKRKSSGKRTWKLKPDAYQWFLDLAYDNMEIVKPGVLEALASYAIKAAIPTKRFMDDLFMLADELGNYFGKEVVDHHLSSAIALSDEEPGKLKAWSLKYIEKLSGLTLPRNKRNFRPRQEHLKLLHEAQSKEKEVRQWQKEHPGSTRAQCARALDIEWDTANRWWKKETPSKKKKVFVCDCGSTNVTTQTKRWYWDVTGNAYKQTVRVCQDCGSAYFGKPRIDNSAM